MDSSKTGTHTTPSTQHTQYNYKVINQASQVNQIFHYTNNWKEGKVNQMWIQEIEETEDVYKYVAVAHNPRNGHSMVMSHPRGYQDTLEWVAKFCGSFSILPN